MSEIWDLLDDFILGPFNLIDRAEGLITGIRHGDLGHQFAIGRADKGADHCLADVERILKEFHIDVYGRTHDSQRIYFHVKNRQAGWAEYLLLNAGVKLLSPPVDSRNAGYAAANVASGKPMPVSWDERRKQRKAARKARR